jgi:hypothetical protein
MFEQVVQPSQDEQVLGVSFEADLSNESIEGTQQVQETSKHYFSTTSAFANNFTPHLAISAVTPPAVQAS